MASSNKNSDHIDRLLEQAMDHYRENNLAEAIALYDQILKADPNNQEALDWRGEIAIQEDTYEIAAACLGKSKELYPDEFDENCKLGLAYYELSESEKAVDTLKEAIDLNPDDLVSHSNLGKALYDLFAAGEEEKAQRIALDWTTKFPDQPDAAHMGRAVAGLKAPDRANDAYVADVFNDFAADFDEKLKELGYQAPNLLQALIQEQLTPDGLSLDILDAGCGTGLCAPLFKPWAKSLHGVDLSPGMLEKAAAYPEYNHLEEAELTGYLNAHPESYELVIAADVLCYFGELVEVFKATLSSLREGGFFAFSLECKDVENFQLHQSGRYSHAEDYILDCLKAAGFTLIKHNHETLRWEYGEQVAGVVVLAQKTG